MKQSYDVVICGAGIAGISTAYHLAVKHGIETVFSFEGNILIIDFEPIRIILTLLELSSIRKNTETEIFLRKFINLGSGIIVTFKKNDEPQS